MENQNEYPSGRLELYGVNIFRGSIYPTEAEEWINTIRKCLEILDCENNEKVKLAESMLQEEAREWWYIIKEGLSREASQDWKVF